MQEKSITSTYYIYKVEELPEEEQKLVEMAREATYSSYAPFSNFKVGAVVLLDDGKTTIKGCNQENVAFTAGICAERSAIFAAGAQHPEIGIKTLCIAARDIHDNFVKSPIVPCGSCRQAISQVEKRYGHGIRILLVGRDEIYVFNSIKDLLPLTFESLE